MGAAAGQLGFAVAVGRDLFLEIAKLRAIRLTWARLVAACGGDAAAQRMHLHVRGSWRERTTIDPWVGLLRGTGETFAAAIGGADSIATTAMDAAFGEPGELGRRMAVNTQLVLAEEAHLGRVADPAGGSGYVEALSDQLARAGWARFQAIEAAGGMAAALRAGLVQGWAAETAKVQAQAVASVRLPIVGVSRFAAAHERSTGATAIVPDRLTDVCRKGQGMPDILDAARELSEGTGVRVRLGPAREQVIGLARAAVGAVRGAAGAGDGRDGRAGGGGRAGAVARAGRVLSGVLRRRRVRGGRDGGGCWRWTRWRGSSRRAGRGSR